MYVIDILWTMEGAPWNVRNVPGTCSRLALGIQYIIGTSPMSI